MKFKYYYKDMESLAPTGSKDVDIPPDVDDPRRAEIVFLKMLDDWNRNSTRFKYWSAL